MCQLLLWLGVSFCSQVIHCPLRSPVSRLEHGSVAFVTTLSMNGCPPSAKAELVYSVSQAWSLSSHWPSLFASTLDASLSNIMLHTTFHLQPSHRSLPHFLSAKNTLQPRGFLQQHRATPSPVVLHFLQGTSLKEKHLKMSSASVPCAPLHLQHPHKQLIFTILLLASAVHADCAASRLVRRSLFSVLTIFHLMSCDFHSR